AGLTQVTASTILSWSRCPLCEQLSKVEFPFSYEGQPMFIGKSVEGPLELLSPPIELHQVGWVSHRFANFPNGHMAEAVKGSDLSVALVRVLDDLCPDDLPLLGVFQLTPLEV